MAGQLEGGPYKCAASFLGGSLHQFHGPPSGLKKPDSPAAVSVLTLSSAVGNFSNAEAAELLGALHRAAGDRCQLLLGADMWKGEGVLRRAYDDAQGALPAARGAASKPPSVLPKPTYPSSAPTQIHVCTAVFPSTACFAPVLQVSPRPSS